MTRHEVFENLSVALDTIRSRKVRSGLTILGIVIGVTTVIAVASIIDGLNGEIKERVERLGSNTLFVTRIPPMQNTARLPAKIRVRKYLEDDDAAFHRRIQPRGFLCHGVREPHQLQRSDG
jgi:putative ABC transport system permease protein